MTQLDRCKTCAYYVKSNIQPKNGVLFHCAFDRPLNMTCGKYKSQCDGRDYERDCERTGY